MIYYVEDDDNIRELVVYTLTQMNLPCRGFADGPSFRAAMAEEVPALILLDVMLPGEDGLSLLRFLRDNSQTAEIPVIMLTAKGTEMDKVQGLDYGADDYIVKPFSGEEVMARIRAILRRIDRSAGSPVSKHQISISNLLIDLEDALVSIGGQNIALTKKELEILYMLADNSGKLFSREALLSSLWGYDYYGDSRTVDSHVKRLRAKIDAVPHPQWQIKTIWGLGYKFEVIGNEE